MKFKNLHAIIMVLTLTRSESVSKSGISSGCLCLIVEFPVAAIRNTSNKGKEWELEVGDGNKAKGTRKQPPLPPRGLS